MRKTHRTIACTFPRLLVVCLGLLAVLSATPHSQAKDASTAYPSMAPLDQYLMERSAEIALARSAAPKSVSKDAEVLVLGRHGYEIAVQGKNGFVCIVERSWTADLDEPDFWNPKLRGPLCLNPPAARTYVPITIKKTEFVLAGQSKMQMAASIKAAFDKKDLPALEPGAMCYMLSKQGYLNSRAGHWHPHLMFFVPLSDPETWGATPDSPVLADKNALDRLTIVMIPVSTWSDGTPDTPPYHK